MQLKNQIKIKTKKYRYIFNHIVNTKRSILSGGVTLRHIANDDVRSVSKLFRLYAFAVI